MAIGHTRYSTAGDTVLLNAQPFSVACNKGNIAVAHNGNITNAGELRRELEREGSIFQASSDTEVILHLVARSRERTLAGALRDALLQLEGAFSLVFLAAGPHHCGPRSAWLPSAGGSGKWSCRAGTAHVFASETCAFDLINAVYHGDVEPGEMVIVGPEGMTRERYAPARRPRPVRVRARVLLASRFHRLRTRRAGIAREYGPAARARTPVDADVVVPVPDSGVAAALGYAAEAGIPFRQALDPQSLRRPDVH
jgi:amidophosphoribosyltransferase